MFTHVCRVSCFANWCRIPLINSNNLPKHISSEFLATYFNQWLFLVPIKSGRDYVTPQKAIYKWYISGIYRQLGDYMPPTTFLGEPETTIDLSSVCASLLAKLSNRENTSPG